MLILLFFLPAKEKNLQKNSESKPKKCCVHAPAALDQHQTIPIQSKLNQFNLFQTLVSMPMINQSIHSITGLLKHVPGR